MPEQMPDPNILKSPANSHGCPLIGPEGIEMRAFKEETPRSWLEQSTHQINQRRLARPIWPDNSVDRPLPNLQVEVIDGIKSSKGFRCSADLKQWMCILGIHFVPPPHNLSFHHLHRQTSWSSRPMGLRIIMMIRQTPKNSNLNFCKNLKDSGMTVNK